jgi:hypothetical protein
MEQQKQDWMSFLADFVDLVKNLNRKFGDNEITEQEILDSVGEKFVDAHNYAQVSELHPKMVHAWSQLQESIQKIKLIRAKKMTQRQRYLYHMRELFQDPAKVWDTSIPWSTRWWYNHCVELQVRPH